MNKEVFDFIKFIESKDRIGNKALLIQEAQKKFNLTKDRSVYYSKNFSVRFSFSSTTGFSNTVISLSNLQKFDHLPFLVCLVTRTQNVLYLANTTFVQKISHSSQKLRIDNIRGSINGSDIVRRFNGINNSPENFEKLYNIHADIGFDGNLERLVEVTTNISPSGTKFSVSSEQKKTILYSINRTIDFIQSKEYLELKADFDSKVSQYKTEILIASLIENVNIRGRIIEYLIAGEDDQLRTELINALHDSRQRIPSLKTKNTLGDYTRIFENYRTATDVKTKIMV